MHAFLKRYKTKSFFNIKLFSLTSTCKVYFVLLVFKVRFKKMHGPAILCVGVIAFYTSSLNAVEALIRNDITNRCLHMGYLGRSQLMRGRREVDIRQEIVYTSSCTWNTVENGAPAKETSHPDQWLEIIRQLQTPNYYFIRKVEDNSTKEICLASSVDNHPVTVSSNSQTPHCTTPEASFILDPVHQHNFKGVLTSKTNFKIRNRDGQCLTVRPGQPFPNFKNCSARQGLFQVWSVCRHNKKCDVDLTWTPRQIVFPKNMTNLTDMIDIDLVGGNTKNPVMSGTYVGVGINGVVNEVLYSVQNAGKLFESGEKFLVNGIGAFYEQNSLSEAHSLLVRICKEERLQCELCRQCDDSSPEVAANLTIIWLMKWMEKCNKNGAGQIIKKFLSEDVYQVPLHLFPQPHRSSQKGESHLRGKLPLPEKYKLIIPNLRKYLNELETSLEEHERLQKNGPESIVSESTTMRAINNDNGTKVGNSTHQDYASIIDIRLFNG